jgi:hypothetical protein
MKFTRSLVFLLQVHEAHLQSMQEHMNILLCSFPVCVWCKYCMLLATIYTHFDIFSFLPHISYERLWALSSLVRLSQLKTGYVIIILSFMQLLCNVCWSCSNILVYIVITIFRVRKVEGQCGLIHNSYCGSKLVECFHCEGSINLRRELQ